MKVLLKSTECIRVIADSAVGRSGQPWFVPDSGSNWRWHTALAYRISKLGKGISPKFAARYVDAVTLLWVAESDSMETLDYMDGAVVCGTWLPLDEDDNIPSELIAALSENTTLKNGDIIAVDGDGPREPIIKNRHVSINLKDTEIISFNIK